MRKNQIHVVKNDDNSWAVVRKHSKRTISRTNSQSEAIRKAVSQAKREGNTEVIIDSKITV